MAKKVCKKCKLFFEGDSCPSCNSTETTETWNGKLIVFKPEQSEVAKNLKIEKPGTYAVKTK